MPCVPSWTIVRGAVSGLRSKVVAGESHLRQSLELIHCCNQPATTRGVWDREVIVSLARCEAPAANHRAIHQVHRSLACRQRRARLKLNDHDVLDEWDLQTGSVAVKIFRLINPRRDRVRGLGWYLGLLEYGQHQPRLGCTLLGSEYSSTGLGLHRQLEQPTLVRRRSGK